MNIFNSGKHAGKSYDEVFSTDPNYVAAVYSGSFCLPKGNTNFLQYIEEHLDEWDEEEDDYEPSGNLSTYVRANWKRARFRKWFKNTVYNNQSISDKRVTLKFPEIKRPDEIPPDIFGTFIDYYIRYMIALKKNIDDFVDSRAHSDYDNGDYVSMLQRETAFTHFCEKRADRTDIFLVSLRHHISFGRDVTAIQHTIMECYDGYGIGCNEILSNIDLTPIDKWIDDKLKNAKHILLNPSIGNRFFSESGNMSASINADADLIIDDEIIDFKCYQLPPTIVDWLQLAGYAWLYPLRYAKHPGYKDIAKLTIYNPLRGEETTIGPSSGVQEFEIIEEEDDEYDFISVNRLSTHCLQSLFLGFGEFFPLITTPKQITNEEAFKDLAERIAKFKQGTSRKNDTWFMKYLYCSHCNKYGYYPSGEHDKCPKKPIDNRPPEVIAREKLIESYKHNWIHEHNEEQRNDFRKAARSGKSSSQSEYIQTMIKLIQEGHIE